MSGGAEKIVFEKLQKIVSFAWKNKYSDFYRSKYKDAGIDIGNIKTFTDFQKLPTFTKDDFRKTPASERLFFPPSRVDFIKYSSGTTGEPAAVYHTLSEDSPRMRSLAKQLEGLYSDSHRILILRNARSIPREHLFLHKLKKFAVIGELSDLELTAKIAIEAQIDAIIAPTRYMFALADFLKHANYPLSKIKLVRPLGERVSILQRRALSRRFAKALIIRHYSGTEIDSVAFQCKYLGQSEQMYNVYHIEPYIFVEIVGGELVFTDLLPCPSPLVRYRSGDLGKFEGGVCRCGRENLVRIYGRREFCRVAVGKSEFLRDDLELYLLPFSKYLTGNFIIEVGKRLKFTFEKDAQIVGGVQVKIKKFVCEFLAKRNIRSKVEVVFVDKLDFSVGKLEETVSS